MTYSKFISTVSQELPSTASNVNKHRIKNGWVITAGEYENRTIGKGETLAEAIDAALKSLGL